MIISGCTTLSNEVCEPKISINPVDISKKEKQLEMRRIKQSIKKMCSSLDKNLEKVIYKDKNIRTIRFSYKRLKECQTRQELLEK